MSKLLEQAFHEASKLPEEDQNIIAQMVLSFIRVDEEEEAEWEALVRSPESQRFLDKMVREVKEEKAKGNLLPLPGER
jgi:hypothetical protein